MLKQIEPLLKLALAEDIGAGDVTSKATIPNNLQGRVNLIAREQGILCGLPVVQRIFRLLDKKVRIILLKKDGARLKPQNRVAVIQGPMRSLLAGERLSLNFLQRLSGIATLTRQFADVAQPYGLKVYDTRKTTPLWRLLERYAVRIGGGYNHRFALYDMVLIKDNHIDSAGGIVAAVKKALTYRHSHRLRVKIGVEVRTIGELQAVLPLKVELLLLDNMPVRQLRRALSIIGEKKHTEVEVSGGITLKRIAELGRAGVKRVSVGALTHSAPALDLACKYER